MESPDKILEKIKTDEKKGTQGKLKIFFGMCAGVGKTYSMLLHAKELIQNGKYVIVGYIETHGRTDTAKLLDGLLILPRKKISYKGIELEEFDLEKAIELKPEFILVDELPHTNIPGSKHSKRYQDVLELLDNGINVLTTLNVQHIESRSKTVEQITGSPIHETIPDSVIEIADNIELIDLPIQELLQRLSEGKVYIPEKAKIAFQNFFKPGNLISLREIALRLTAEKVESDLVNYMSEKKIEGPWKAGDKLLVAVGSSPFSAELIRWTRRMAYALKTQWYALYVKTDTHYNEKQNEQLEKNLRLAKELGAEVITTANTDLVDGLLEFAKRHNVSQIIIGKPAKYSLLNYIRRDNYINRLIHESGNIDIYIIRSDTIKQKVKKKRIIHTSSHKKDYIISAITVLAVSAFCFPFTHYLGYQSVGLLLLFNLLLLPFYVGRGAILFASLLNLLIWDFFFIPPTFTFDIAKLEDFLTLLLNLLIAITSGLLATRIKQQKQLVQIRENNALALLNFTREVSSISDKNEAISIAMNHINSNFNIISAFFNAKLEVALFNGDKSIFNEKEITIARWALENNKIAGKFTSNLPNAIAQYLPVTSKNGKLGVMGLILNEKLKIEEENLIENILNQMHSVYEKIEAEEKVKNLLIETESKKLYDTLLDSISHEFRTPIAVILGSSTSLLEKNITEQPDLVRNFADEIYLASKRLNILVENLLDITRLELGKLKLNIDLYNFNEVIAETLLQLKDVREKHNLVLDLKEQNPIIRMDYGFISQSTFNILHNAFFYTPEGSTITISGQKQGKNYHLSITDNGLGLDEVSISRLFEKFYRPPGTKAGGTGLGLSIAKGFIEAHGGSLTVKANEPSGLIFDIFLPYE